MRFFLIFLLSFSILYAEEQKPKEPLKEQSVETAHAVKINNEEIRYKATAGTIVLKDDSGKDKASIFFVSYIKEGVEDPHSRPITFCFNGGPGSSSVWLHLGVLGPRRVDINGVMFDPPPYDLVDNPYSILDQTDLVFIDPVSTGYSRAAPGEDVKQFHGVEEDVASVGSFIRLFATRYGRWESPKFLAGESYGSTRAALLADHLHDTYGMFINGVILISSALNFQTLMDPSDGNDLPYILSLPSLTATAWYHKKLSPDFQSRDLAALLKTSEQFALHDYTLALMQGDHLPSDQQEKITTTLSSYTGLTSEFITRANLRLQISYFGKELLRDRSKTIGRFDGRVVGDNINEQAVSRDYDPSYQAVFGAFTAAFYQYVTRELNWKSDEEYKILTNVWPWNFGTASNSYLNVSPNLREVMIKNPSLQVLVASGIYDLATPYFAIDYTLSHLNLPSNIKANITSTTYLGGHMMYTDHDILIKLKEDLSSFYHKTLEKP